MLNASAELKLFAMETNERSVSKETAEAFGLMTKG